MEKELGQEYKNPIQREAFLKDNCDACEQKGYMKPCKRLNLMLRWLCRQDGVVDLGIWHNLKPSQLMMPLDVHVARVGRELGLITRQGNDRKTVEELTRNLAAFDPQDPCKYDFALFGIGESQKHDKR